MMDIEDSIDISPGGLREEEFNELLSDDTFVDFLNTFLSLPVFPKRLLYNSEDYVFEIDPPVKRTFYHVLQRKVKLWVRTVRFPMFLKTDLFLDYSLCRLLLNTNTGAVQKIHMYLNSVENMHAFRRFLRGTMGERIFAFWLDAERYRRQTKAENRRYVFREIQNKYLQGGSPFELTEMMKWKSLCGGMKGLETKSFTAPVQVTKKLCSPNISIFSENIFVPLQKLILQRLRSYWVPKFIVHRERMRMRWRWGKSIKKGVVVNELENAAAQLKAIRDLERNKDQEASEKDSTTLVDDYMEIHKTDTPVSVDEDLDEEEKTLRMERWKVWFWGSSRAGSKQSDEDRLSSGTGSRLSYTAAESASIHSRVATPTGFLGSRGSATPSSLKSSASSPLPRLTSMSKSGSSKSGSRSDSAMSTPEVLEELNKILAEDAPSDIEEEDKGKKKKVKKKKVPTEPDPTVTPPLPPISHSSPDLEKQVRMNLRVSPPFALLLDKEKGKRTLFEAIYEERNKNIEDEKRWSPNELLPLTTLQAIQKAPLSRIIQLAVTPDEVMRVFLKPRSAHPKHAIEYQRILQDIISQTDGLWTAVSSDRLAGGPFEEYLKRTQNHDALVRLQFWNEAQRYLVPAETLGITIKYRMAMTIVGTFLMPDSPKMVPMNPMARKQLIKLLPIEQGDAILIHESHNVVQGLMSAWMEYFRADEDHFVSSVTKSKKIKKIVPKFSEDSEEESDAECDTEKLKSEDEETKKLNMWRALELAASLAASGYDDDGGNDEEEEEDVGVKLPSLKEINRQREEDLMTRRGTHFYGLIRKEITHKPNADESQALIKTRPNRPRNFQECLYDNAQFAWFKKFLSEQASETSLVFWQAVENMKNNCKDAKSRQARANVIVRKYFINIDVPASENLQCKAEIIRDIPTLEKVTPPMLLSAQACVARSMEEQWFRNYVATFPEEDEAENVTKYAMRNTLAGVYKMAAHGKTRGLWAMFASNVMSFQKGIYDLKSEAEFISFLYKEKEATIEHNTRRHALNPTRRMINNKFINTEKLVNDLSFWKEVLKFKEMADNANECAKSGNYSSDDEYQLLSKAKTIARVFINSDIPPRVQINISNELGESINNLVETGIVERGIFHEAALSIFTTLIHYWKKFSAERKNVTKKESVMQTPNMSKKDDLKRRRISYILGVPYRRVYVMQEDETRWTFSLLHGLRLAIPLRLLARRVTRGDVLPQELSGATP